MTELKNQKEGLLEVAKLLREHQNFLIVSHIRPDGDSLGSLTGLLFGLESAGKRVAAYAPEPVHPKWAFLKGVSRIATELPSWRPDVTVVVDCGSPDRVGEGFEPIGLVVDIDHHLSNDFFGDANYVNTDACAAGEQIYDLLAELGIPLNADIATALYVAVMTDTGGFRFSNTSARTFHIAADCVNAGADPAEIGLHVFETKPAGEFVIRARVFSNLHFECDGALVWSEIRMADYEAAGGEDSEPEGLSSEIRGIEGVEVSCLIHEMEDGTPRVNFRGKGKVDCSAVATACGGGGHFNASGAVLRGKTYEEGKAFILEAVREAVADWKSKA